MDTLLDLKRALDGPAFKENVHRNNKDGVRCNEVDRSSSHEFHPFPVGHLELVRSKNARDRIVPW